jgi:peptidoglycan hydrolase-like protein with peptidoglycan-binding domain
MRTVRFVVSLLMGLALVMGTTAVSQAAPASEQARPRCQSFTTFTYHVLGAKLQVTLPTSGYMNGKIDCELWLDDRYDGVFVLQGAISDCFTKIKTDAIYGPVTESVVRLIQGQNGITTDGVYGPDTRDVMLWPWFVAGKKRCMKW